MLPLRSLVAATALLVGGCATFQSRNLTPAVTMEELDRRRLSDPGLARFLVAQGQVANGAWDLARLTLTAFYFSPELDVARARVREAEAGLRTAGARPNPAFTFAPGRSEATPGGISPWILGYALDVRLETAGRRRHRIAEAQHGVEGARLELAAQAWQARSAVRRALAEWQGAEEAAALWRGQLPLLAQAARMVEAQVQAGEVAPVQVVQRQAALQRTELAAREADRLAVGARSRLAEVLGVTLAALEGVPLAPGDLAAAEELPSVAEARAWAARNRADLLAALAVYAAAQAALQGEVARQYPDMTLGPGYTLDQGEGKWTLGLGVTLPVLHQNQGPIAAAEARRATAAAQFLALQNRVLAEVDRAAADCRSVRSDLRNAEALRANLELQTRALRAQQAAGETSRLDLVRAELLLADHARLVVEARLRVARAIGALEDAVQRPLAWSETAWRTPARETAN